MLPEHERGLTPVRGEELGGHNTHGDNGKDRHRIWHWRVSKARGNRINHRERIGALQRGCHPRSKSISLWSIGNQQSEFDPHSIYKKP